MAARSFDIGRAISAALNAAGPALSVDPLGSVFVADPWSQLKNLDCRRVYVSPSSFSSIRVARGGPNGVERNYGSNIIVLKKMAYDKDGVKVSDAETEAQLLEEITSFMEGFAQLKLASMCRVNVTDAEVPEQYDELALQKGIYVAGIEVTYREYLSH